MKPTQILIALAAIVYAAPGIDQRMALFPPEIDTHSQLHAKRCGKGKPKYRGRFPYPNETYNQLTDGTPCRNVTLIYARGMGAEGNVGAVNETGPTIFNELAALIGQQNLAIEGVKYNADIKNVIKKPPKPGGRVMSELINLAATQCPDTKIVLVGHSAGGALLHQSAENITAEVTARIAAAVTLGYKKKKSMGRIPKSRSLVVCRKGDSLCGRTTYWEPWVLGCPWWFTKMVLTHQNYDANGPDTAIWIADRLRDYTKPK